MVPLIRACRSSGRLPTSERSLSDRVAHARLAAPSAAQASGAGLAREGPWDRRKAAGSGGPSPSGVSPPRPVDGGCIGLPAPAWTPPSRAYQSRLTIAARLRRSQPRGRAAMPTFDERAVSAQAGEAPPPAAVPRGRLARLRWRRGEPAAGCRPVTAGLRPRAGSARNNTMAPGGGWRKNRHPHRGATHWARIAPTARRRAGSRRSESWPAPCCSARPRASG